MQLVFEAVATVGIGTPWMQKERLEFIEVRPRTAIKRVPSPAILPCSHVNSGLTSSPCDYGCEWRRRAARLAWRGGRAVGVPLWACYRMARRMAVAAAP